MRSAARSKRAKRSLPLYRRLISFENFFMTLTNHAKIVRFGGFAPRVQPLLKRSIKIWDNKSQSAPRNPINALWPNHQHSIQQGMRKGHFPKKAFEFYD